ncbi:nuclear transport factor 2 family protein [Pseudactinotalea suaedae]|uniref:nuclear transport factor 2 family protein n=1 Tax=Pseudactinotalea suaedae TaxID=1524924 RepID=UPI0012E23ABD|nr:nuclear transport factor 2 family protein [Pseudactinotalea suaedae]
MSTPLETVLAYHRSWTSGDVETAMTHVADAAVCHAPGEDLVGKDAYREFLAGFAPNLTGLTHLASLADGNRVALFYHPHTAATSTAPAAELFTVRDGLIVEDVLAFDRLSFGPPELA